LNAVSREPDAPCSAGSAGKTAKEKFTADFLFYKAP
jgi:hypothetical protein